jgi:membrane protease YdiL (CAAX protease family)
VLGIALLVLGIFVAAPIAMQVPYIAWLVATGQPVLEGIDRLIDLEDPTPAGLAYVNLVLATAIPLTFLVCFALHGLRPGWLSSVRPRIRWPYFAACLGLSVVALVATVLVAAVLPQSGGTGMEGPANDFTRQTRDFLLVVVLLTPFQAAGEEYFFRGYLTQAFGGLFGSKVVAVVLPALLFALAHGLGQSWPVFFDRFAFGLVAGVLVIGTGGLEAAIAMHVLNNFLAFGLALAFGDMASALNPTGGSWWSIPVTLTQSLVYLALATWTASSMGLSRSASQAVLERSGPRV